MGHRLVHPFPVQPSAVPRPTWAWAWSGLISRAFRKCSMASSIRPRAGQGNAQTDVGLGIVGLDFQRLPVLLDRLVDAPVGRQGKAQIDVGVGIVGLDFQGLPVLRDRLVDPAAPAKSEAQVVVGRDVAGVDFQGFLGNGPSPRRSGRARQGEAKVVVDLDAVGVGFQGPWYCAIASSTRPRPTGAAPRSLRRRPGADRVPTPFDTVRSHRRAGRWQKRQSPKAAWNCAECDG